MSEARERWIDGLLGGMSLEQKVGQLVVFSFAGTVITPDVEALITKNHIGGLRISQKFRTTTLLNDVKPGSTPADWVLRSLHRPAGPNRDYTSFNQATSCTAGEYAEILNRLRTLSLERPGGIPIHFTIDQEGNGSDDLLCGQHLFPSPMGLAATGEPEMAYRVALAIGRQARAVGINMLHSPVLDVNTNPRNPEIGPRAYSDAPETVTAYALQSLRGFQEAGVIATGKHFPGRGESDADAHWGLPVVNLELDDLMKVHVAPYVPLIEAGLPAVMVAQCCYPALGVTEDPATTSRRIVTELLRDELGFDGIITTDNMMMGGVLQRFELTEAAVRTVEAGCDLVLCRDESPVRWRILEALQQAVREGRIPEAQLDASVQRVLRMRYDMGLHENGGMVDPARAEEPIHDPQTVNTAVEVGRRSVLVLRDKPELLPLPGDARILLVEQVFPTQQMANNQRCHPGMLWEEMLRFNRGVASVEVNLRPTEQDYARVRSRLDEADIIVTTNYYYHKAAGAMTDMVRELHQTGKPVVTVTNNPFPYAAPDDFPTTLTVFTGGGVDSLRTAAEIIFGARAAVGEAPVAGLAARD